MKRVELDLETCATSPNAVVLSIGAVVFDPAKGLGDKFYQELTLEDQFNAGRIMAPATIAWWMQQSDEARKVWRTTAGGGFTPVKHSAVNALQHFSDFLRSREDTDEIWSYGANFDCVVLGSLYETMGVKVPWAYRAVRCHRTLAALGRGVGMPELIRAGTHHNALDDAVHQANDAIQILNHLGVK